MATFSPPPPRRTTRTTRARAAVTSAPQTRLTTPPIRAATKDRVLQADDASSHASEMDVDDANLFGERVTKAAPTIFAKSNELTATFYAELPLEVRQVMRSADFYRDEYTGDIDIATGFALVASVETCFVWKHTQLLRGAPMCYIFRCPPSSQRTTPHHILIPHSLNREPGLVLVSVDGEIRFWDSIGIGLAGGDHYTTTRLNLNADELITCVVRRDPQTFVATSSTGRLFRLNLTSSGGKQHIASHIFAPPQRQTTFSNLLPSLWSSSSAPVVEPGNVNAVTFVGNDVWALVDSRLQKWHMAPEGWEELVLDEDMAEAIRSVARKELKGVPVDDSAMDLELLDITSQRESDRITVLISYAGMDEDDAMDLSASPRRIYALLTLSTANNVFQILNVTSIPYQSTSSSGAPMHPRIKLVLDGALIAVQFGDAVAICARDSQYQDRLELKSATDRTLGLGILEADSAILILTAATMIRAQIDMDVIKKFDPESGRAELIKSIMTQAILYGSNLANPLNFSFPPNIDEESLMAGAQQLSHAVLVSDPEIIALGHDLNAQMTQRKERLNWLIKFINENGALGKMSQRSRQRLAANSEKLYAAHQLWLMHNEFLAAGNHYSILAEAIFAFMSEAGDSEHEDVVRAFFRYRVLDLGRLVSRISEITRRTEFETGRTLAEVLPEANDIVLTVLKSTLSYRELNLGVYGVELPIYAPWSSRSPVIDTVLGLFDATTTVTTAATAATGQEEVERATVPGQQSQRQLPELALVLFSCVQERLDWLGSAVAASDAANVRDYKALEDRFLQLKPEVLETLRRQGYAEEAFSLAEKYRDFASMAALCHKDTVYPFEENPNEARIKNYIERFREQFTNELYKWYQEHGEIRLMFAKEDTYGPYMDKYFASAQSVNTSSISWIHDLGQKRHGEASETLLKESKVARDLETKHLMLSIGKLALLAQTQDMDATVDEKSLDGFHDQLDFVSVHEVLLSEFKEALANIRGRHSIDAQVDIIAREKASKINQNQLTIIFKFLAKELLHGCALTVEDVVDLLTLKNNEAEHIEDYATALYLLARDTQMPTGRRLSAFRSVWRRIYNHDDWDAIRQTAGVTDEELLLRFRSTATYNVLRHILPKLAGLPAKERYDLAPDQVLMVPSLEEVGARWPDEAEGVSKAIEMECNQVRNWRMDDVYPRIRELAIRDIWEEQQED